MRGEDGERKLYYRYQFTRGRIDSPDFLVLINFSFPLATNRPHTTLPLYPYQI